MNRVRTAQASVMNSLLQPDRLTRLVEQGALDGPAAYTAEQFLGDLRRGIWSRAGGARRTIDPFRRNTQRVYLDTVDNRLNGGAAPDAEVRSLLRGELRDAAARSSSTAIPAMTDRASRLHLEDAATRSTRSSTRARCGSGLPQVVLLVRAQRRTTDRPLPGVSTSTTIPSSASQTGAGPTTSCSPLTPGSELQALGLPRRPSDVTSGSSDVDSGETSLHWPLFVFVVVQAVVRQCRACLTSDACSAQCWSCSPPHSFSPHQPPSTRRLRAPCRTASSATRRRLAARRSTRSAAPAATARHSPAPRRRR